jgi:hypothetical protein
LAILKHFSIQFQNRSVVYSLYHKKTPKKK